jgi:membrane-associated phospholipid phosphatase
VTKDSFNHSFPSGHTVRGLLLAFLIAELVPTLRPLLAAWLVVMSASLVLTSMHTPTDVAGGVLLALVALVMLNQRVRFRLRPAGNPRNPHTGGIEEPLAPGGVP